MQHVRHGGFHRARRLPTRSLYLSQANSVTERLVDMNLGATTFMRAPGEAPRHRRPRDRHGRVRRKAPHGSRSDPPDQYAKTDPSHDQPYTAKRLRECYQQASERFGWSRRNAQPGKAAEGDHLIGYGMATAT
ncbi:MAG: hypothetical protein M3Y50_00635 [Acidobacteriota bacterium]|nr:hypothetical protein [Acidobacteriota bacterium]